MRAAIIGFAIGTACLQQQAALPERAAVVAGVAGLIVFLVGGHCLFRRLSQYGSAWAVVFISQGSAVWPRVLIKLASGVAGFIAGFLWAAWLAHRAMAPSLAPDDEGRDFIVIGTIDNLPYRFAQGVRFHFAVERVEDRNGTAILPTPVPPRIAISWYSGFRDQQTDVVGDVQPGERWRLTVRLQRPHGNANPHTGESWRGNSKKVELKIQWTCSVSVPLNFKDSIS